MNALQVLLAELKRRRVFRVAAVYGAAAFVALQAADLVFPRLGLPDWTVTLVVALGVIGLPVALALAWAFDATPDGVRRTGPAAATSSRRSSRCRVRDAGQPASPRSSALHCWAAARGGRSSAQVRAHPRMTRLRYCRS
jgi:hypothetical protein